MTHITWLNSEYGFLISITPTYFCLHGELGAITGCSVSQSIKWPEFFQNKFLGGANVMLQVTVHGPEWTKPLRLWENFTPQVILHPLKSS